MHLLTGGPLDLIRGSCLQVRLLILEKHGGIWVDLDSLIFRDLRPFLEVRLNFQRALIYFFRTREHDGHPDYVLSLLYFAHCSVQFNFPIRSQSIKTMIEISHFIHA
jgi:hypothetical protein